MGALVADLAMPQGVTTPCIRPPDRLDSHRTVSLDGHDPQSIVERSRLDLPLWDASPVCLSVLGGPSLLGVRFGEASLSCVLSPFPFLCVGFQTYDRSPELLEPKDWSQGAPLAQPNPPVRAPNGTTPRDIYIHELSFVLVPKLATLLPWSS